MISTTRERILAHVLLFITNAIIWGAMGAVNKLALNREGVVSMIFATYRHVCSTIIMLFLSWLYYKSGKQDPNLLTRIAPSDWKRFLIMGLCCYGTITFFILGLGLTSATSASSFQPATPVVAMCISSLIGLERFTLGKGLGVLLATAGAITVVIFDPDDVTSEGEAEQTEDSGSGHWMGYVILGIQVCATASLVVAQVRARFIAFSF